MNWCSGNHSPKHSLPQLADRMMECHNASGDKCLNKPSDVTAPPGLPPDTIVYVLTGVLSFAVLTFTLLGVLFLRKYRSLVRSIRELEERRLGPRPAPRSEGPVLRARRASAAAPPAAAAEEKDEEVSLQTAMQRSSAARSSSRRLWRGRQQVPRFTETDLNLLQLIKAGKEGVFYQAKMTRGTCKGHNMFTCKISKAGVRPKHVDREVSIMRKLVDHKNILQLLDWSTNEEPYILIMEYVSYGTLRTFLQSNRDHLSADPELQSLLTIASYHIALAMHHLHSKMIVHCDLALRNVMVNKFPWEVKVAEFGLARDLSRITSRHSTRWRNPLQPVPLRWYPPEYFKNNHYSFKGDVWAFGIVLWEMQTFGTLPYPDLETSEAVVYHICIGHKNKNPDGCRPEILHIMQDCWREPYTLRSSFTDIVRMLENTLENDADYLNIESLEVLVADEAEYHESKYLRAASVTLDDGNPI